MHLIIVLGLFFGQWCFGILAHIFLLALHISKWYLYKTITTGIAQSLTFITEVVQGITNLYDIEFFLYAAIDTFEDEELKIKLII